MATHPIYQIKKRFTQMRKKLGKTQKELAELTGLSQAQISQIENGAYLVSDAVYIILQETLSVNRQWLEHGDGAMFFSRPANLKPGEPSVPSLTQPHERLRYLRLKERLTLKEMAEKLGTNSVRVQRHEKGTVPMSASFVSLVCDAFKVSSEWLLSGVGDMYKKQEKTSLVSDVTLINVQLNTLHNLVTAMQKQLLNLMADNHEMKQQIKELSRAKYTAKTV